MNRHGNQKMAMGDNTTVTYVQSGQGEGRFKQFLEQHIVQALTKGFDDNVGRHPIPALFEARIKGDLRNWFYLFLSKCFIDI